MTTTARESAGNPELMGPEAEPDVLTILVPVASGAGAVPAGPVDISKVGRLPKAAALRVLDQVEEQTRSIRTRLNAQDLEEAIEDAQPTGAVAGGVAVSQRLLNRLDQRAETRLLTAPEAAVYTGHKGRNWAAQAARDGRIIQVEHANKRRYPAFQFDPDTGRIRDWVAGMVELLDAVGIDGRAFAVWAASKTPRFDREMPAMRAGDSDFLQKAAGALAAA